MLRLKGLVSCWVDLMLGTKLPPLFAEPQPIRRRERIYAMIPYDAQGNMYLYKIRNGKVENRADCSSCTGSEPRLLRDLCP